MPIERFIRFVSQLEPETGLENLEWIQHTGWRTGSGILQAYWDPLQTPDTVTASGARLWYYKMNGIRFAIDGHNDLWNYTPALKNLFNAPNPVSSRSAVLPTNSSHVAANFTQVEIPNAGFSSWGTGAALTTTHYRIWIDGVDKTGIVTLGTPFPHNMLINTEVPNRVVGGLMSPVSIPAGAYKGKSVWFDLWVTVTVTNRPSTYNGDPTNWQSYAPAAQIYYYAQHHRSRFLSASVNAKRHSGDQYRVTFADNGPGGASSLDVATGGGWTLTSTASGFQLVKPTVGIIELNWSVEVPILTCTIDAKLNSPTGFGSNMRYFPNGTDYRYRHADNSYVDYGTWNPQGTTVFKQIARGVGSGYREKGPNWPASAFTGFPSTITVEKI